MKCLASLLLCLIFPASAMAQLRWDKKALEVQVGLADDSAHARFEFVNDGKYPVTFDRIRTCCGLRTEVMDKRTYAPGEHGSVTGVVRIGNLKGKIHKSMAVETDDAKGSNVVLDIDLVIPELIDFAPEELSWVKGEKPEAKAMSVKVIYAAPFRITGVRTSDKRMSPVLITGEDAKQYKIVVTPVDTNQTMAATIYLDTDLKAGDGTKTFEIDAMVN